MAFYASRILCAAACCAAAARAASFPGRTVQLHRDGSFALPAPEMVPAAAAEPPAGQVDPPSNLTLGVPALGSVGFKAFVYYSFMLNQSLLASSTAIYGLVTAIDGDLDMCVRVEGVLASCAPAPRKTAHACVRCSHSSQMGPRTAPLAPTHTPISSPPIRTASFATVDGTQPSASNFQYADVSFWGFTQTQAVVLTPGDGPTSQHCASSCPLILGVRGTRPGNFTIIVEAAGSSNSLAISPGNPLVAPIPTGTSVLITAAQNNASIQLVSMSIAGFAGGLSVLWSNSLVGVPAINTPTSYCYRWCVWAATCALP